MLRLLTAVAGVAPESQFFWVFGITGITPLEIRTLAKLPASVRAVNLQSARKRYTEYLSAEQFLFG